MPRLAASRARSRSAISASSFWRFKGVDLLLERLEPGAEGVLDLARCDRVSVHLGQRLAFRGRLRRSGWQNQSLQQGEHRESNTPASPRSTPRWGIGRERLMKNSFLLTDRWSYTS